MGQSKRNVVFLTPFRNAAGVVARYFESIGDFVSQFQQDFNVKVFVLEGDSADDTRKLVFSAGHKQAAKTFFELYIFDVSHSKKIVWKSVEDSIRLETMGRIMDRGLEEIRQDKSIGESDIIVWIMSDLEFRPSDIKCLIDALSFDSPEHSKIIAPKVLTKTDEFYDTWAFRLNGARFLSSYPFHSELVRAGTWLTEIDSAGSCLVMTRSTLDGLSAGDQEAISFCSNARSNGVSIWLNQHVSIFHGHSEDRPKLLYVGYFFKPFSYARLAHALVSKLAETFEITILAIGYNGDPHDLPYRVWPSGADVAKKLGVLLKEVGLDVVVLHDETYGITKLATTAIFSFSLESDRPLVFAWTEIEGTGQCSKFVDYGMVDTYVVPSEFAVTELSKAVEQDKIVKVRHGVDTGVFNVRLASARQEIRSRCEGIEKDTVVFGTVCVNQMRKRIDLSLRAFAIVCEKSPSADLKMVVLTRNVPGGYDLSDLCTRLNILDKVAIIYDQYSDRDLSELMNVFDVFVSTSIGEGWCLAAHEALACGARLVAPNHSGFTEWCNHDVENVASNPTIFLVDTSSIEPLSPVNELVYVDGLGVDFSDLVYKMGLAVEDVLVNRLYRSSDIQLKQADEMTTISQLIIDRLKSRKVAN